MTDSNFPTPEEVADRYHGGVSINTLRNWRAMRVGPSYVKIGKAVPYRVDELEPGMKKQSAGHQGAPPKCWAMRRDDHAQRSYNGGY